MTVQYIHDKSPKFVLIYYILWCVYYYYFLIIYQPVYFVLKYGHWYISEVRINLGVVPILLNRLHL